MLDGIVQSRPAASQLAFIEETIRNVAQLDTLNFDQSMFLLRGLELLWKSVLQIGLGSNGNGRIAFVKAILQNLGTKLAETPLVRTYHDWLADHLIHEVSSNIGEHALARTPESHLELADGVFVFVDHDSIIVASNGPPFIRPRSALHIDCDEIMGAFWHVWVEGFPTVETPMKKYLDVTVENLAMLETVFETI